MIWFTSDTHFGHSNIIKYTGRPFKTIEEMNECIINRWNSRVKEDDTVFFLGDFSLGNPKKYLERLNGNIVWIKGNHDKTAIIKELNINYGGYLWHLAHKPEDCTGRYNLCGHVHEKWKIKVQKNNKILVNVGVDQWDFYPIKIQEIIKEIKNKI